MSSPTPISRRKEPEHIPDDWEDDDDEDVPQVTQDSKMIWDEANKRPATNNMPIIMARTGGGSSVSFVPPAEAFNKPRQILRRQLTANGSGSGTQTPDPNSGRSSPKEGDNKHHTLAEREKAYLDARDRIFGKSDSSDSHAPTSSGL